MTPEEAKQLPKELPNPLDGLPAHLKDPDNFEKVQRALLEAGATPHSHSDIGEWQKCVKCAQKMADRSLMMQKLGFKDGPQYLLWKKTHEYIKAHPELK